MAEKAVPIASKDELFGTMAPIGTKQSDANARERHDGVFALVLVNLLFYVADHLLGLAFMKQLYMPLDGPSWYQYFTSMFCHAGWTHLSGNLFFLYLFGKLIEEKEGTLGVVVSYLLCGLGANLLSVVFLSGGVALGASGAVFGLFVVGVLIKLEWNARSLIEALILGQFVVVQIINETKSLGEKDGVGHLAHVGGALTGVALVIAVNKLVHRNAPAEKKTAEPKVAAKKDAAGAPVTKTPASGA